MNTAYYCPSCGSKSKRYDSVKRIMRIEYGEKITVVVERYICENCRTVRRMLPEYLLPNKHYKKSIILGFVNNEYTTDDIQFEDYPSEVTISRWKNTSPYFHCV